MSFHDNSIPVEPAKNLERLQNIAANMENKLYRKEEIYKSKQTSHNKLKALIEETDVPENLSQEQMEEASRREQILIGFQIELEQLKVEISKLRGKLRWNSRRQEIVEGIKERENTLTYKPFNTI